MRSADLLAVLQGFYADARAQRVRHEASARQVGEYDFNNTYQYVLNREDAHLRWLRDAIASIGGSVSDAPSGAEAPLPAGRKVPSATVARDDARAAGALVDEWQRKLGAVTHARHRRMLDAILGEVREHQRFFEQVSAGCTDLLGRRTGGSAPVGRVLPARWVE